MKRWLILMGCLLIASLASGQGGETGGGGGPGGGSGQNLSTITDDAGCLGGNLVLRNAGDSAFGCLTTGTGGMCLTSAGAGSLPTWGTCGGSSITMPAARLLGRTTTGTGAPENIQVSSDFTLSSLLLSVNEILPSKVDSDTAGDYGKCAQFNATTGTLEPAVGACGTSTGMTSFSLGADTGTNATVGNVDVADITGGTGITTAVTTADPTHTVTVNLDLTDGVTCSPPLSCSSSTITTSITGPAFVGRSAASLGVTAALNAATATGMLNVFTPTTNGLVPFPPGGSSSTNFLNAAGNWAAPSSGGAPTTAEYVTSEDNASLSADVFPSAANQVPVSSSSSAAAWGVLPLAALTDAAAGSCLISGGSGDPSWGACGGGGFTFSLGNGSTSDPIENGSTMAVVAGTGLTNAISANTATLNIDLTDGGFTCAAPLSCAATSITTSITGPGILGKSTAGAGTVATLSGSTVTDLLDVFSGTVNEPGLVPADAAGGALKFLREDATWQIPPGGSGSIPCIYTRGADINCLDAGGCTGSTVASATMSVEAASFLPGLDTAGTFDFIIPPSWAGQVVDIKIDWTSDDIDCNAGGTDTVCWNLSSAQVIDGGNFVGTTGPTFNTALGILDTCGPSSGAMQRALIANYTPAWSTAASHGVVRVARNHDNASPAVCGADDQYLKAAKIVGIEICLDGANP